MRTPHIDDAKNPDLETNQTKNGFLCLVSKLVIDEKLPIRFMYKTVPDHLNDTGWRMYTGYETEDFLEDELLNMIPMPVETMCKADPTLTKLVEYNAGTVWERHPGADENGWERVYDYKIPSPQVDVSITNDADEFNSLK
ncbi:hypothetical protein SAMN02745127_01397 [Oceanospirillum multiglobuliferum]|uniref:Immunity protein Imm33 domain-containing protein n=1 Tax=Oceanospirillum multiglobuliferum TaxID=64969 RepID=A0A1T4PBG3_9GAMM|nr:DUF2185 domain-containing protein [Oceanospirillum multiglobuliferum]OPX55630.1 hypothetical protein BTE48_08450 [Oceanospirillum multiglobuliferum]SJZ88576.1 hypothetical protein SAMN02745127_01397 [Oceanospirillum multiglobuliferum]